MPIHVGWPCHLTFRIDAREKFVWRLLVEATSKADPETSRNPELRMSLFYYR